MSIPGGEDKRPNFQTASARALPERPAGCQDGLATERERDPRRNENSVALSQKGQSSIQNKIPSCKMHVTPVLPCICGLNPRREQDAGCGFLGPFLPCGNLYLKWKNPQILGPMIDTRFPIFRTSRCGTICCSAVQLHRDPC